MDIWRDKLAECTERCSFRGLPTPRSTLGENQRQSIGIHENTREVIIPNPIYNLLRESSVGLEVSLPAILQYAWHTVLSIYGHSTFTVVCACVQHTSTKGPARAPPYFYPMIFNHTENQNKNINRVIKDIEEKMSQEIPILATELQENTCDSFFAFGDQLSSDPNLKYYLEKAPLLLHAVEMEASSLVLQLFYPPYLFLPSIIDGFLDVMVTILGQIDAYKIDLLVGDLKYLPEKQERQIRSWNNTDGDFPSTKRLHHLFEEAAALSPDRIAVVTKNSQLTYLELNARANELAHYLHYKIALRVEEFIGIFLEKTELLLVTVFGIWKSGAAYVPIDPNNPDDRVKFILNDTQAQFVITSGRLATRLTQMLSCDPAYERVRVIDIELLQDKLQKEPEPVTNLELDLRSNQLAYVTYTSGTTGVPKGVFKEHRGVVNSITDLSKKYEMEMKERQEVVVLFSGFIWEPFVRQSLIALINSHKLVIVDDLDKLDPVKFPAFLQEYAVSYLNATGSVLQEFDLAACPALSKLILVGEEFTASLYGKLREKFKGRIISEYGFTESALVTAMKVFDFDSQRDDRTIGQALRNVKCYILDRNLKEVPVGCIGELHIGGMGISRGYLNNAPLTASKFIPNPFQTATEKVAGFNSRIYKTGDLARWVQNGQVEYIGRNDFQIKLRGIRIEPGEIESVVKTHEGVLKCAVVVKGSGSEKYLIGYFVTTNGPIEEEKLMKWMETKLPRYMIPVRMVQVQKIPVTVNGKVDFRALPQIELGSRGGETGKEGNKIESTLRSIWSQILNVPIDRIGFHDDFFRLGGHSISCIQLIARVRQQLGLELSLDMIFELATIVKISEALTKSPLPIEEVQNSTPGMNWQENHALELTENLLANSLQQGLMYHYLKQSVTDDAYIMQSEYEYRTQLDVDCYRSAWLSAQMKYPALRLRFSARAEILQIIDKIQALQWQFMDYTNTLQTPENVMLGLKVKDMEERYTLETGALFRIYLVKFAKDQFTLLFSCHHSILDGWSLTILFAHVHKIYLDKLNRRVPEVLEIDKAYIQTQRYLQLHQKKHLPYWEAEIAKIDQRVNLSGLLNECSSSIQLPSYDRIRNPKRAILEIPPDLNLELRQFIHSAGFTLHSILQFVWHKVLHAYGGGTHTVVGTTVAGRNLPIPGIENSVGLFINTLPLILDHSHWQNHGTTVGHALTEIQSKVNTMNSRSTVELGRLNEGELTHELFDCLFVLENYPNLGNRDIEAHQRELGFKFIGDFEKLDYPLVVIAREESGERGVSFSLWYAGELFEESVVQDLLELVAYMLVQVVRGRENRVVDLHIIHPSQLEKLDIWNSTRFTLPPSSTLHSVFEEQVAKFPSKIALIYNDCPTIKLTYAQLNGLANQLSRFLKSTLPIRSDDKIALVLDKNEWIIVSILGIWKGGGAFVPIDPSFPAHRIKFIVEDTGARVVITNSRHVQMLEEYLDTSNTNVISIEKAVKTQKGLEITNSITTSHYNP